jgi:transposase
MGKTLPLRVTEVEDAPTIDRMSVRGAPIEVITRGERRRVWTPEQKRDIVMERWPRESGQVG